MFKFLVSTARKLHLTSEASEIKLSAATKAKPQVRGPEILQRSKDNPNERGAKDYRRPPMIF
jgi:hypothetical protein